MGEPVLTIGLPVYNGGMSLKRAIDSLRSQTYRDLILHISDNASTDETPFICLAAAQLDGRVVYTRQPENIGGYENFRFVLQSARTPFFMWAAHDDYWKTTFVEKNLGLLMNDQRATASISRVAFQRGGTQIYYSKSTHALQGTISENLHDFLANPVDASRFYAVHRTENLKRCFPTITPFHAFDWLVVALTLLEGHYLEWPEVLLVREAPEPNRYSKQVRGHHSGLLMRLFPGMPLTYQLIRRLPRCYWHDILRDLGRINREQHYAYMKYFHPKGFRIEQKIYRKSGMRALLKLVKAGWPR
jgi:glycosyltransferase involved in cell wall biosynthesis